MAEERGGMADTIFWLIEHLGYAGIALLTFAETIFPPLPSEVIIPVAAYQAQRGAMNLAGVVLAGTAGSMAGNMVWFALARRFGLVRLRRLVERHGRWLTADWHEIERAERYFMRHGTLFVCTGRLLPAVRTFISLPAGLARMNSWRYLLWSTLGAAGWTLALAGAGWNLGVRYGDIETILRPLAAAVIVPFLLWYLWRLVRSFRRQS
jgi:membrane protein DedA with SNARE-associated domain